MKKNNVRIKNNITLTDEINAINGIVSCYFTDGEYTNIGNDSFINLSPSNIQSDDGIFLLSFSF